jgi:putative ABC transport system permease protein
LRAVGASRRQVVLSVLTEALAVGLLASTLGLGAGFLVAKGLVTVMGFIGLDIGGNGLVFAGRTAVAAYVVGILVTLLAALGPARRAAKVPPVAALRDDVALPERSLRRRAVIGLVGSVVGAIAMVGGLAGSGSSSAALVGFGALLVFIGVAALNPFISRPVVAVLGAPLPRLFGTPGRLSRENARRNPRRTAATAAALMIGMALVSTMSVLGASAKTSVSKIVEDSAGASFVLQSSMPAPFSTEVAKTLEGQPGVAEVASLRLGQAKVDGKLVNLNAWTPSAAKQALKLQMVSGKYDALGSGQLLVTQSTAKAKGWTVGQTLDVTYPNPKAPHGKLQIGGIYKDNQLAGRYMVSTAVFEEHFNANQQLDFVVLVDAKPGTDLSVLRHTVETSVKAYPNIEVKDQQEFINATKKQVDQLLNIIYALLALAIVIAVLGIVNTLALSVIERTREIGLLRAVGMSRRQLRRMVRLESVVIAVFGALLGISLGILFGAALVRASKGEGITELVIPVGQLVGYVIAAGVVGVLAALWPARRAAKLNVLKAIATD